MFAERAFCSKLCQEWTAGRMPELPEVETVRRGLALKMTGRRIVRAELRRPDLRRPFPPGLSELLGGATIGALGPSAGLKIRPLSTGMFIAPK